MPSSSALSNVTNICCLLFLLSTRNMPVHWSAFFLKKCFVFLPAPVYFWVLLMDRNRSWSGRWWGWRELCSSQGVSSVVWAGHQESAVFSQLRFFAGLWTGIGVWHPVQLPNSMTVFVVNLVIPQKQDVERPARKKLYTPWNRCLGSKYQILFCHLCNELKITHMPQAILKLLVYCLLTNLKKKKKKSCNWWLKILWKVHRDSAPLLS